MSANRLKNKPRDRSRLKQRRLREQAKQREAGQELPADLLADLAAAMAALAHPGKLYMTLGCHKMLGEWADECTARGGEFLAVIVRSTNPHSCCGAEFIGLSTVQLCNDSTCRADHKAKPAHVAAFRSVLRRRGPEAVRASAGWRTFGEE